MYESIERYTHDFVLYVLCMDDRCYEILSDLSFPRFIPIKLSEYETPDLLKVKTERSVGEYCWTNSSCFTQYVMSRFKPDFCAYIDSDLYFYDDPNIVIKEMQSRNASVMIVGHRFYWFDKAEMEDKVGKYCVEFNTFKNDENGTAILNKWRGQCLEYCKADGDGIHYADQKYLDNWCVDYPCCVETENYGAGVAPWNIAQYKMLSADQFGPTIIKCNGKKYKMFFFHYASINYQDEQTADVNACATWGVHKEMVESLYINYLRHVRKTKIFLQENFGLEVLLKKHPGYKVAKKESITTRVKNVLSTQGLYKLLFKSIPWRILHANNIIHF